MLGKIINFLIANKEVIAGLISTLAAWVTAWKLGANNENKKAEAAKDVVADLVYDLPQRGEHPIASTRAEAEAWAQEKITVKAKANKHLKALKRRQYIRDRVKWLQKAKER